MLPQCATAAPYCGRGPLQITWQVNYQYCDSHGWQYGTTGITTDYKKVWKDIDVCFGTGACVSCGISIINPAQPHTTL